MKCIGIDVSKINFTVAYPTESAYRLEVFNNDSKGIKKFITSLGDGDYHCVLEATGTYSTLLVSSLGKIAKIASGSPLNDYNTNNASLRKSTS